MGAPPRLRDHPPLLVGCLIGLVNSFLIIKLGISDMLTTLSMMFVITGVSITFQEGSAILQLHADVAGWGRPRSHE